MVPHDPAGKISKHRARNKPETSSDVVHKTNKKDILTNYVFGFLR